MKALIHAETPNSRVHVIVGDVGERTDCKRIVEASAELMGGIDVLLLNAGIGCLVELEKVPEEDLAVAQEVMNVNYLANVHLSFYALPLLRVSRGMIIVNSSLAGIGWSPGRCFYSASKHALRGFFNSLRCEVGHEVQVTMTYPGFVMSEIHDRAYHEKGKPLQRSGDFMSAERCAELILQGAAKGSRDYCMTWLGSFALKTTPFLGSLNDILAIRKANSGIKQ